MSATTSPMASTESEERPTSSQSMSQPAESDLKRTSSLEERSRSRSPRPSSIQFTVNSAEELLPVRSASTNRKRLSYGEMPIREMEPEKEQRPLSPRRGPSPPPPRTYERGVSFDTFDNRNAAGFSLTLNYKHKGYQTQRRSRTFLCGTDQNEYSEFALEWLLDELVDDGDEIICLRAVEKDSRMASDAGIEEGKYRKEAERLLEQVVAKNSQDEKAISLVLELAVGKVEDIIQRMIRIYEPVILVVGTRGRNLKGVQSLLPGSVSKYCLQHSPIPVIVVRPSTKREKKKKKRRADPARRSYNQLLELSEQRGSRIFDAGPNTESGVSKLPDEEAAVAEALGLPSTYSRAASRSSLSTSERSSLSHDESSDSPSPAPHALDAVVMKSPLMGSPASSEESVSLSEETEKPVRPATPVNLDGPASHSLEEEEEEELFDDAKEHQHPAETDAAETTTITETEPPAKVLIPTIEISNDNNGNVGNPEPEDE